MRAEIAVDGLSTMRDAVSGQAFAKVPHDGRLAVPLDFKPHAVRAFGVDSANAKLTAWKNQPVADTDLVHVRTVIADAEKLLTNKTLSARLPTADRAFLTGQIAAANAALASQRTALAWSVVSHWRFWSPARTQMDRRTPALRKLTLHPAQ